MRRRKLKWLWALGSKCLRTAVGPAGLSLAPFARAHSRDSPLLDVCCGHAPSVNVSRRSISQSTSPAMFRNLCSPPREPSLRSLHAAIGGVCTNARTDVRTSRPNCCRAATRLSIRPDLIARCTTVRSLKTAGIAASPIRPSSLAGMVHRQRNRLLLSHGIPQIRARVTRAAFASFGMHWREGTTEPPTPTVDYVGSPAALLDVATR